jgi:altronate hydrolase
MNPVIQIHPRDNVGIVLRTLKKEEPVQLHEIILKPVEDIPAGHKIALADIPQNTSVVRYGYSIGRASINIPIGSWVHSHNLRTGLHGKLEYLYQPIQSPAGKPAQPAPEFMGYLREDGSVGIRNEIWIINTVGCINKTSELFADKAREMFREKIRGGDIDGIYAFSHPYGCSQLGADLENTQRILAGLAEHPNAAGVLVVGLGCENNRMEHFRKFLRQANPNRVKFLSLQDETDEFAAGLESMGALVEYASRFKQTAVPASKLIIGLKCGGSDSFSGITANPLVGQASDQLIAYGGTAVLSEVPEMFGAETILMNRACNKEVFEKTVCLINDFKDYFIRNNQAIYENPSPGNQDGGITTLEEKSLGCILKGGTSAVMDVLKYGEQVKMNGLNLLEAPGNDIVSTTALTAAGAHMILFTTGRGTPMGAPVPTIKIASNSVLAGKKMGWIDFNAGRLNEGASMDDLAGELFDDILAVAGKAKLTRNEINGYRDVAIFKTGVTL